MTIPTISAQMTFKLPVDLVRWAMRKTGLSQREAIGALLNAYMNLLPIGLSEHRFVFDRETGTIETVWDDEGRDVEYFDRLCDPLGAALGCDYSDRSFTPLLDSPDVRGVGDTPLIHWVDRADGSPRY